MVVAMQSFNEAQWPRDYSLLCFSPTNPVRRWCVRAIKQPWWDPVVITAILASSFCLVLDSPRLDPESDRSLVHLLKQMDIAFTVLFFIEMSTKIIALGFAWSESAYLSSPWNQVDFVLMVVMILVLLAEAMPQLRSLRILRVARVLRPLRLISRNAGMRLIITSLFKAMPGVHNVFGVVIVPAARLRHPRHANVLGAMGCPTRCVRPEACTAASSAAVSVRRGSHAHGETPPSAPSTTLARRCGSST